MSRGSSKWRSEIQNRTPTFVCSGRPCRTRRTSYRVSLQVARQFANRFAQVASGSARHRCLRDNNRSAHRRTLGAWQLGEATYRHDRTSSRHPPSSQCFGVQFSLEPYTDESRKYDRRKGTRPPFQGAFAETESVNKKHAQKVKNDFNGGSGKGCFIGEGCWISSADWLAPPFYRPWFCFSSSSQPLFDWRGPAIVSVETLGANLDAKSKDQI